MVLKYLKEDPNNSYYKRFFKATIEQLAKINNSNINQSLDKYPLKLSFIKDIICKSSNFDFNCKFKINKKIDKHVKFLFFDTIPKTQKIIISLSGGVDSMICSYILKSLEYDFIAIFINYNNRKESFKEEHFVRWWCYHMNIPLYVRKITEINRNKNMRDFYEKITQKIRFDMYKKFPDRHVVLGHNKDDCIENIFTNIKKQVSLDNLFGMEKSSIKHNVTILRPMLDLSKKSIMELANKFNIPYLFDSTPNWSERGKMRDNLIPMLNKFDKKIIHGLINLTKFNKELYSLIDTFVIPNFNIKQVNNNLFIEHKKCTSFIIWKKIFNQVNENYYITNISNKSIRNFLDKLSNLRKKKYKINLKNNLIAELTEVYLKIRLN